MTYETWADEAALQAHMVSPTMKALLAGEIQQDFLSVLVDG